MYSYLFTFTLHAQHLNFHSLTSLQGMVRSVTQHELGALLPLGEGVPKERAAQEAKETRAKDLAGVVGE
jgi:hypothetical protein